MKNTTLGDIRRLFIEKLVSIYTKEEADRLFFIVVEDLLKIEKSTCHLFPEREMSENEVESLRDALNRLSAGEPVQHISGRAWFWGMELKVNKHTLIPRPETEELIDLISKRVGFEPERIMDIGTGSGCIALACARLFPGAHIEAVDISQEALEVARQNVKHYGGNIRLTQTDFLLSAGSVSPRNYDIIVSNPPYIRLSEQKEMHKNVLDHEPHSALFVKDSDPLIYYKAIEKFAWKNLSEKGRVFLEINQYLGKESLAVFEEERWVAVLHEDLSGNERFIEAGKHRKNRKE